ncbi:DUF4040 domain-containing protein [Phormidium sp. CCY1219]|uniref:DUF4040 domain-containing protein n=1 Tax=Phormidium sp. CCY1219 TaxID=2886104 RepID=UPI002D1EFBE5|nr:DUF4040 domain-containing protein [Phormidium sp. CCY1219]MEB3828312.1 DUF4040 domain-containing protein [Phormidium sp. CCY1219]
MIEIYIYVIVALLPLAGCMLVLQSNPFHALIVRGILGAVAALVYALLGAADVALTEALMGTLLSITLYAVAVRSSMVMRLGVIREAKNKGETPSHKPIDQLRAIVAKRYLRLELVRYSDEIALNQALENKEIHALCIKPEKTEQQFREDKATSQPLQPYHIVIRIPRLYDMVQNELPSGMRLTYANSLASPTALTEQPQ